MSEPIKTAYSLDELRVKLSNWMVAERGKPKDMTEEKADNFYRDFGLIYHFLSEHFPQEKEAK